MDEHEIIPLPILMGEEDILLDDLMLMSDSDEFDSIGPIHSVLQLQNAMQNARLQSFFAQNVDLSDVSSSSSKPTCLQAAVKNGDKLAVKEELQKKSHSWKVIDDRGRSMLHLAIEFGESKKSKWIQQRQRRRFLHNPRIRASQIKVKHVSQKGIIEILEIFLELGLDINARTNKGESPLWLAVKNRMNEVIEFLVERGADVMVKNANGDTLAHMIVKEEIDAFCSKHKVAQDVAYFKRDNTAFWDWLLSKGIDVDCQNACGETAYRMAINKNVKNISLILAKYTNEVHYTNSEGQNILHMFLDMDSESDSYVLNHTNEILRSLLKKGVPVNAVDNRGRTPLHIAAKRRKASIMVHLLEHFTNVNACNEFGDTVLHVAIDMFGFLVQSEEIIRTLISKGTDIYIKNKNGMTPVQLAAKHKDEKVLRVLQENQADFSIRTDEGETLLHLLSRTKMELTTDPDMVDLLVKQGCDVNATNVNGMTPLHLAAKTGCATIVKGLLKHGANVHSRENRDQMTPLHLAALEDHEEMIEDLIKAGADVNSKDATGKTPLHLATYHSTNLLKALLKFGALVDAKDNNGRLPLHDVLLHDNTEGLECLLACGADINDLGTPQQIPFLESIKNKIIWNKVIEHLVTLKAAKIPMASIFKPYIDLSSKPMKKFFAECLNEIEDMKKISIAGKKSVYDLLLLDPYRRYAYVRTMRFKVLHISPCYFESTFRKYCGLIRSSYKEAIERKPLLEPAKFAWYQLTKISLPDICIERILAYLNNSELNTMIEGAQFEMET